MHFSKIFAGIAMTSGVLAALSGRQIADGIKTITQKSAALQAPAQSITVLNAPLIVIGQGPLPGIIAGFTDITSTGNTLVSQISGSGPIQKKGEKVHARDLAARGPDADAVFTAFREVCLDPVLLCSPSTIALLRFSIPNFMLLTTLPLHSLLQSTKPYSISSSAKPVFSGPSLSSVSLLLPLSAGLKVLLT